MSLRLGGKPGRKRKGLGPRGGKPSQLQARHQLRRLLGRWLRQLLPGPGLQRRLQHLLGQWLPQLLLQTLRGPALPRAERKRQDPRRSAALAKFLCATGSTPRW